MKFQVGDRVRVIDKQDSNYGCIITIQEWDQNSSYSVCASISSPRDTMNDTKHDVFRPSQLELIARKSNYV